MTLQSEKEAVEIMGGLPDPDSKTQKPPFKSPLQHFIDAFCKQCPNFNPNPNIDEDPKKRKVKGLCSLYDKNALARMNLCIQLLPFKALKGF